MSERIIRLNELFKREISEILLGEKNFGREVLITITRVDISPDLSGAKVFVSVMPQEKQKKVLDSLGEDIYHIQQRLNKKLFLKKIPKIVFYEEKAVEEAARIEELISEIHRKDRDSASSR